MKTLRLFVSLFVFPFFALAQVGIGTISPNAQLEIAASDQAAPANNDGLLIPKIDEFPAVNPTAAQNGMMVFVTGSGTPAQGFYYWDNTLSNWQSINTGAESINQLNDGRSDDDGSNDGSSVFIGANSGQFDDLTDNRNVGLGYWALLNTNTGMQNVAVGNSSMVLNTSGSNNTALGRSSLRNNSTGNFNTALGAGALLLTNADRNVAVGNESLLANSVGIDNIALGYRAGHNNNGNNNVFLGSGSGYGPISNAINGSVFLGYQAGYNETTDNKLYIDNSNTATPLIYGEFDTNILRANGTFQIGDPSGTGYALPSADGTANQVLQSDGAGSITWQDIPPGVDRINALVDGRSDNDGTDDGSSIFLGLGAGANDDQTNNRGIGIGMNALGQNTAGFINIGIGSSALAANTIGSRNISLGVNALLNNTTGSLNLAMGDSALLANDSGDGNIAIGPAAMIRNQTGEYNIAMGFLSLYNSTGNNNLAMGYRSLFDLTAGDENTALGNLSQTSLSTGSGNTSTGHLALANNSTGSFNVAIGRSAGGTTSGEGNTIIGAFAKSAGGINGDYNVFIGYSAGRFATGSNQLWIENTDATVPLIYGEFDNDILRANGTFQIGDPSTTGFALPATDGAANQVLQTDGAGNVNWASMSSGDNDWVVVGGDIERQSGNVYIGDNATTGNDLYVNDRIIDWDNTSYYLDPDATNYLDEVSLDAGGASDPSVTFGDSRTGFFSPGANMLAVTINNAERLRIDASGNVGINTTNPAYDLEVSGEIMLEDTAIPGHTAGHSGLFSRSGELYAIDSSGNITVISPHHFELVAPSDPMAWSFYSQNETLNRKINVDMLKVVRTVEQLSGDKLVFTTDLEGNQVDIKNERQSLKQQVIDQQQQIDTLKAELKAIKAMLQKQ